MSVLFRDLAFSSPFRSYFGRDHLRRFVRLLFRLDVVGSVSSDMFTASKVLHQVLRDASFWESAELNGELGRPNVQFLISRSMYRVRTAFGDEVFRQAR